MAGITDITSKTKKKTIILLTGMSGTGKSTVLGELSCRGYEVIDTDYDGWSIYGEDPRWDHGWIWHEVRMKSLLSEHIKGTLFISGTVSNQGKFYPYFDSIVLLSAPLNVMRERIENRTINNYGKTHEEWKEIVHYKDTVEPLLRDGVNFEIDTRKPLNQVVDELEKIANTN
ncbi:AAA family ATPase [Sporosarcina jiandibaonis]|uniref:AAA family ATPase n=1 Tax=Sporosarcina jiandibaonis TaxID=2715535 RepID=UPI001C1322C9|nr:AAA family ATPase [Sporosarcina jiandibaonis]